MEGIARGIVTEIAMFEPLNQYVRHHRTLEGAPIDSISVNKFEDSLKVIIEQVVNPT